MLIYLKKASTSEVLGDMLDRLKKDKGHQDGDAIQQDIARSCCPMALLKMLLKSLM